MRAADDDQDQDQESTPTCRHSFAMKSFDFFKEMFIGILAFQYLYN